MKRTLNFTCMNRSTLLLSFGILMSAFTVEAQGNALKPDRPNVLFIAVDDLRPELNCYGETHIKSPNIDRLAQSGIVFANAFSNWPVCGPSRASMLSGIYPSNNRFGPRHNIYQDKQLPGAVSLPMHFHNNNYTTVSLGKVYHNIDDGKGSWDKIWRPYYTNITGFMDYQSQENIELYEELDQKNIKSFTRGPAYEKAYVPDIAYREGRIAKRAVDEIQNFQHSDEPFFLAVGFHKPHLPFNAPARYWDMYDEEDIYLPSNYFFPKDAPDAAKFNWGELRAYHGIPKEGPVPDSTAHNLIHGYYACISYVDAQIGLILDALNYHGLAENTIVVLWGDHGWFLGEHGFWTKHSNFKRGSHAPLIVKVPWEKSGLKTEALVEFVDVYPSLCEFAGLSLPFHLQGKSFAPLLDDPEQDWKEAIFYKLGRAETVMTETHAYTEWINNESGQSVARMLYDHRVDPEENVNVAELPENKKLIEALQRKLHGHLKERDQLSLPVGNNN